MSPPLSTILSTTVPLALAVAFCAGILYSSKKRQSFPPGPRGFPLVGNALDFDPKAAWKCFTSWKLTYGETFGLSILGNKILVLCSHRVLSDLLDKRGSVYADRPRFVAAGELMGLNQSMTLMPYGTEWRACRKLEHIALSSLAVKKYQPLQERLAATLVLDIVKDPENFYDLVRLSGARVILAVTYGLSPRVIGTEYIAHADETMHIVSGATLPGAFLCDFVPILKFLPSWFPFQRRAAHGRLMIQKMVDMPYNEVKRCMASRGVEPSLTHDLLIAVGKEDPSQAMEDRIKWTTGSMYAAGGETTFGITLTFIMLMVLHPEAQRRAQVEIDNIIGSERLPSISDRHLLPYVTALIKEVLRWNPILPVMARRTTEDDMYEGYHIPKHTVVLCNLHAIASEPNHKYPPEEFLPERFLDLESKVIDPYSYIFGYGRRICPGKLLGEASIFILITTLLAAFEIGPQISSEETLIPEFEDQLVRLPKRFKCSFVPRSAKGIELATIRAAE